MFSSRGHLRAVNLNRQAVIQQHQQHPHTLGAGDGRIEHRLVPAEQLAGERHRVTGLQACGVSKGAGGINLTANALDQRVRHRRGLVTERHQAVGVRHPADLRLAGAVSRQPHKEVPRKERPDLARARVHRFDAQAGVKHLDPPGRQLGMQESLLVGVAVQRVPCESGCRIVHNRPLAYQMGDIIPDGLHWTACSSVFLQGIKTAAAG